MTNIVEFDVRASIERQAREWLIRLDGDAPLTRQEAAALREWMSRSPSHREEIVRISKFWSQANVLTELAVSLEPGARGRAPRQRRWMQGLLAASVALFAVVMAAWWFQHRPSGAANGTYATAIGAQQTIVLEDGSSVQMNTDSQVQIAFSKHLRRIRLLRGEALFSVTPEPSRPFEVYVADSTVRAVGTAFAIQLEGGKVDVTVTKGIVDVAQGGSAPTLPSDASSPQTAQSPKRGRLKAGETTRLDAGTDHIEVRELAEPELQRRMAWREGYLAFSGEPLSEVIEQVNRYSPVTLKIGDPKLTTLAIGGRFRIGDLDAVLEVLQTNFGIRSYQIDNNNIRLESERRQ